MRHADWCAAVLACFPLVGGCPKKKADVEDAAPPTDVVAPPPPPVADAAVALAPPDAGPAAKNAAEVARFAVEVPLDEATRLGAAGAARTLPRGGPTVASLKSGADVVKIAQHQDCFLVTFADPKDPSVRLMGWVGKEAFAAGPDAGAADGGARDAGAADAGARDAGKPALKCAAGQIAVALGPEPSCKKKCARDADCKGGSKGSCAVAAGASGGKAVHVCVHD